MSGNTDQTIVPTHNIHAKFMFIQGYAKNIRRVKKHLARTVQTNCLTPEIYQIFDASLLWAFVL